LLRRGNRLSITPVEAGHWALIVDELLAQATRP
jgi:predicted RNA-binding protein with PUA-like domain